MLIGVISVVRSFIVPGDPLGKWAIKAAILIIGATVLFGFLIIRAGLIVALLALVLVSAAASEKFRFDWKALAGLVVLIAFCALVFVKGLGVPMPLVGTWFGG
jgi:putative tricarboxylic transport membrane protein